MKKPTAEALRSAALWLDSYEGVEPGDETEAHCKEVADWLSAQAAAMDADSFLRAAAKKYDMSLKDLRARYREVLKNTPEEVPA